MRLLMVARRYPPDIRSGTETVFENLYAQAQARHEVRLVVGYTRDRALVPAEARAVDLRGLSRPRAWARIWRETAAELLRFRPDAVLSNSIEAPVLRAPTACVVHDLNFGQAGRGLGTLAREGFYRAKAARLGAIITPSEASAARLEALGVARSTLHVCPNGVDLERFCPAPRRPLPGLDDAVYRFAYPSRILPGKAQHLALDALGRLPRRFKERAHLTLVGAAADPLFVDQLRIQAFQQPAQVLTDVADIVPFYQQADCVLFPSLMEEGFGFTAIEAMACGKPVIWFDQPAVREATGGHGFPVPSGDVDAMRDVMRALIEDPAKGEAVGAEGRAFVEARYGWGEAWARYEAVLEQIRRV
ncbi:MAG: glycosyltransferase family 4 protein [Alphaproteobacteria bacterium]|nr:glycosyltransferase family 4 protein [Alphaproteobacteria bacterium]